MRLTPAEGLALTVSPVRLGCVGVGALILALLYRRITTLGRLTVALGALFERYTCSEPKIISEEPMVRPAAVHEVTLRKTPGPV